MSIGMFISCMQAPRRTEPWHVSAKWWASQVVCVTIEEVAQMGEETESVQFYMLAHGHGQNVLKVTHLHLKGPPDTFLDKYWDRPIVAYTQMRQNFWAFQPQSWITYHVSTILEVDLPGGQGQQRLFILVERVDDRLEIMMGVGFIPRSFMLEFRATGRTRRSDRCIHMPRQTVRPMLTVRQLFDWFGTSMRRRWQPYHILQSNCQHVAEELERFIADPAGALLDMEELRVDRPLVPLYGGLYFAPSSAVTGMHYAATSEHVVLPAGAGMGMGFVQAHPSLTMPYPTLCSPAAPTIQRRHSMPDGVKLSNMPLRAHGQDEDCSIQ